ncbi:histidinol-phosphate transaminase [Niabella yanshanensis]|uniref:Histidinol-phosphate transaminase n=1 Tax=Niabella yanshanensis TaxID=577386 RepID=A0ABZ0WBK7_9BACT|nr:histidinol-phosphate transaminase [Niabella yanshanensis]WQD39899.1 histidinol-phosphate transaminase [Niabella yanshanensis]
MHRRELLKQSALAVAAFGLSRDIFATESRTLLYNNHDADIIKLSSNENPYGPSPKARKAMSEAVNSCNRYPWENTTLLREKISVPYQLAKENVIIGAGSSELLGLASVLAALKKGNIVAPDPTFRLWIPAAKKIGAPVKLVPLTEQKAVDLQRLKEAIDADTRMVYICNPNNPTGTVLAPNELETFIKDLAPSVIILLDEAYTEFEDTKSVAHLVNEYPNLIVAKTFSKIYGMAGARVGYALAHANTIQQLNNLQPWANAGAGGVSLAGAIASLEDTSFVAMCKKENAKARNLFYQALDGNGIPYIPSATSFVYFDTAKYPKDFKAVLEAKNIIGARSFEESSKWLRLSVGTIKEMEQVAAAIRL